MSKPSAPMRWRSLRRARSCVVLVALLSHAAGLVAAPSKQAAVAPPVAAQQAPPGQLLSALEQARTDLAKLAPELAELERAISAARLEQKALQASRLALRREWTRRLGNAERAVQKHQRDVERAKQAPVPRTSLETARTEYEAALPIAAEIEKADGALARVDAELQQRSKLAEQLGARAAALAESLRAAEAPLTATLQRLDLQTAAVARAAGMVRDKTGVASASALAAAERESARKLALVATAVADVEGRAQQLEQKPAAESSAPAPSAGTSAGPELVGIRLGMSQSDAQAALTKSRPDLKQRIVTMSVRQNVATEWSMIDGSDPSAYPSSFEGGASGSYVRVLLGSPPKAGVVLQVIVSEQFDLPARAKNAPTLAEHVAALTKKYGKPSAQRASQGMTQLEWIAGGAKSCVADISRLPMTPTRKHLSSSPESCPTMLVATVQSARGKVTNSDLRSFNPGQLTLDGEARVANEARFLAEARSADEANPSCDIRKVYWPERSFPEEVEADGMSGREVRYADLDGNGRPEAYISFHIHSCSPRSHTIVYEMQKGSGCPLRTIGLIDHSGTAEISGKSFFAGYDACATCQGAPGDEPDELCPDKAVFDEYRLNNGKLARVRQNVTR